MMKPAKLSPRGPPVSNDVKAHAEDLFRNSACVECGSLNPTFINSILGVFICVLCKKYHLQIFGPAALSAFKENDVRSVKDTVLQQLLAGGNHKSNMQWEVTIPPQIAALKLHRGSPDSHREEWLTRKYQQMLFVAAAKGHVQIKIDKADHAIVRKSGVKKHLWLEGWAFIRDDRLEVYTDYPPKPHLMLLDLCFPGMNIVKVWNAQNTTVLEHLALVSTTYDISLKGDNETTSDQWATSLIGAFQRHMYVCNVDGNQEEGQRENILESFDHS